MRAALAALRRDWPKFLAVALAAQLTISLVTARLQKQVRWCNLVNESLLRLTPRPGHIPR